MDIYEETQKQIEEFFNGVIISKIVEQISTFINDNQKQLKDDFSDILKEIVKLKEIMNQNNKKIESIENNLETLVSNKNKDIVLERIKKMSILNLILNIFILVSILILFLAK